MHDESADGGAALARKGKCGQGPAPGLLLHVRSGPDDEGIVAAQFGLEGLAQTAAVDGGAPSRGDRAGQRHGGHARVLDHQAGGTGRAEHQVDESRGQTCLVQRLDECHGRVRGLHGRFPEDPVPEGQGRGDLADGQGQRVVPGGDEADHAARPTTHPDLPCRVQGDLARLTEAPGGHPHQGDRAAHLALTVGQRLADLQHQLFGQRSFLLGQQVGPAVQAGSPLVRRAPLPVALALSGHVAGQLDLPRAGQGHPAQGLAPIRRVAPRHARTFRPWHGTTVDPGSRDDPVSGSTLGRCRPPQLSQQGGGVEKGHGPAVEVEAGDLGMFRLVGANGVVGDPDPVAALVGRQGRRSDAAVEEQPRQDQRIDAGGQQGGIQGGAAEGIEEALGMYRLTGAGPQRFGRLTAGCPGDTRPHLRRDPVGHPARAVAIDQGVNVKDRHTLLPTSRQQPGGLLDQQGRVGDQAGPRQEIVLNIDQE